MLLPWSQCCYHGRNTVTIAQCCFTRDTILLRICKRPPFHWMPPHNTAAHYKVPNKICLGHNGLFPHYHKMGFCATGVTTHPKTGLLLILLIFSAYLRATCSSGENMGSLMTMFLHCPMSGMAVLCNLSHLREHQWKQCTRWGGTRGSYYCSGKI